MLIRTATLTDVGEWVGLRGELWPDTSPDAHREEAVAMLAKPPGEALVLLAVDPAGGVCAFAEAALRRDHVNGCETSPVAFLEGIYVRPGNRGSGLGRDLTMAVECWARDRGCAELASDALLENVGSHGFHEAVGFAETERVVCFRKLLEARD